MSEDCVYCETPLDETQDDICGCDGSVIAQKDRELEQSRQSEAQAWSVLARVLEWAAGAKNYHHDDEDADIISILADTPEVLAVVDIPDDQTTLVLSSDPSERVTVLHEHVGGGSVIVLRRDEGEK